MPIEPTVFVVDDDEDMRNSLKWLIESVNLSVEAFASAEHFLTAYHPDRPGCLLLDIRMPGMGGLRLLEHLRAQGTCLPIIVLTGHGDVPLAVQVLKMGAFDFIEKPAAQQQMLDRIRDALAADQAIRAKLSEQARIASLLAQLTNREYEVLERVVAGQASKVIAAELGISEKTVEKHREHVMRKMEAHSLAELIQMTLLYRWNTGNP